MPNAPQPQLVYGPPLVSEITNATQLLAVGLNQLVEPGWYASEPASAFTCLSSGVERVLKLAYSFDLVNQGGVFPTDSELRKLGHDLVSLENVVAPTLLQRANHAGKDYVARLITEASCDPYWPGVLAALNAWAVVSGRYRDLSILSGSTVNADAPASLWQAVESGCVTKLGLLAAIAGQDSRAALVRGRTELARSVLRWWYAIYRVWTHGLLGAERIAPGTGLSPADNRQLSTHLAQVVKAF